MEDDIREDIFEMFGKPAYRYNAIVSSIEMNGTGSVDEDERRFVVDFEELVNDALGG